MQGRSKKVGGIGPWGVIGAITGGLAAVTDTVGPKRGSPAALAFTLKHAEALSDRLLRRKIRSR